MAFSSCAFDHHLQSTGMIFITTSMAPKSLVPSYSCLHQLLLLQLLLTHSDKVKQLHGACISYNKETTIRLLPVADKLQNMIISYNNVYHIMS